MRRASAIAALLVIAGCLDRSSPSQPDPDVVRLGVPFRLSPGETAEIQGEPVRIRFEAVTSDSRCPPDVACAWAGEVRAALVFERMQEPPHHFELSTHAPQQADHAGYRTSLRQALPPPRQAGERIPPSNYVVELQVDR